MYINPINISQIPPVLPNNPTDTQRHEMLYNSLAVVGRTDDYQNITDLLAPPRDMTEFANPGEFKNIKVGIIGGGLSGMAAAFELRKLGFDITIFEPNTKWIGGRVYTYYFDSDKRIYAEMGAIRIPISHETTWHYINTFKLNTESGALIDPNTFTYVRNIRVRNDPKEKNIFHKIYPLFDLSTVEANIPWPQMYINANWYYLSTMPPDVRKQLIMIMSRYDYRHEALGKLSLREALQKYGLSNEAVSLIASVMPEIGGLIHSSYESVLSQEYSLDFLNLYRIQGGMSNLPLAFHKSLTSPSPDEYPDIAQSLLGKVHWREGYAVTMIYMSDRNAKVALGYKSTTETGRDSFEDFDYVICAAPFSALRDMSIIPCFSGRKMQAIRELMYEDSQKTLYLCKERFWEKQGIFHGATFTDSVIQIIAYPPQYTSCMQNGVSCPANEPGVLIASYNISQDALRLANETPGRQRDIITREVEMVHGLPRGYLNNIIMDTKTVDWFKEPWFYGAFLMFLPGQKKDFSYVATTPEYDNRVFFAGEHASTKNAWMQGALQSGMSAANDIAYYSVIRKHQK